MSRGLHIVGTGSDWPFPIFRANTAVGSLGYAIGALSYPTNFASPKASKWEGIAHTSITLQQCIPFCLGKTVGSDKRTGGDAEYGRYVQNAIRMKRG